MRGEGGLAGHLAGDGDKQLVIEAAGLRKEYCDSEITRSTSCARKLA
jgi:hypothetical protein